MTTHISICRAPKSNTYCVGRYSLNETVRLMEGIDHTIESHTGWPIE